MKEIDKASRYPTLDGWRGISISLVLAGHLLPLGPKSFNLNSSVAASGMAIFFILSGFLITSLLIKNDNVFHFLTRRFLRILPLAWLASVIALFAQQSSANHYLSHLLFYANWPPMSLTPATGHLWSLCVEIQFYIGIALLVWLIGKKTFILIPLLCLAVTANRIYFEAPMAINTYFRVDEILAGSILALVFHNAGAHIKSIIGNLNPWILAVLLILSGHPDLPIVNYLRPYIALLLVGSTLLSNKDSVIIRFLNSSTLLYLATISYALYVIHGMLGHTWLGSGETLEKYLKRPLLFAATFALAHFSTFYYENYWIQLGKKLTGRV